MVVPVKGKRDLGPRAVFFFSFFLFQFFCLFLRWNILERNNKRKERKINGRKISREEQRTKDRGTSAEMCWSLLTVFAAEDGAKGEATHFSLEDARKFSLSSLLPLPPSD